MKRIRIAICDDLAEDRERYARKCGEVSEKYHMEMDLKQYQNGNDLLFDLEEPKNLTAIDIILLNIHMPGPDGIEVADQAHKLGYRGLIVFITGSREHYEPAFDVRGFSYITKGKKNNEERFEKVLINAIKEVIEQDSKAIVLSAAGKYKQINISSIKYFEVKKNLITVHYGEKVFEFISTLNKLENQLESQGFYRVQKAFLISLNYVESFNYNEVTMQDGTVIPVGRKYYKGLKENMEYIVKR